ncbi:expressed unknown protein [Seminavis robusta]|uniref:Uncharacterized protein n=1 Tax=Seminavis robusta TaxID=568900 RepID=A0A9N8HQ20_9STRA|nr:expressed unknown protein [Seminavis robusta]|eukprot:Sro1236_g255170.1 n/a (142) ;mRNA; r:31340-31765
MVQPKSPTPVTPTTPAFLTRQAIFYVPLFGMVSFGLAAVAAPQLAHSYFSDFPFPDDPSYFWHFALREFLMGCMFGTVAVHYHTLPVAFVKRMHQCHLALLILHIILNNTVMQYSHSFKSFLNTFQIIILFYSGFVYLKSP